MRDSWHVWFALYVVIALLGIFLISGCSTYGYPSICSSYPYEVRGICRDFFRGQQQAAREYTRQQTVPARTSNVSDLSSRTVARPPAPVFNTHILEGIKGRSWVDNVQYQVLHRAIKEVQDPKRPAYSRSRLKSDIPILRSVITGLSQNNGSPADIIEVSNVIEYYERVTAR
jgi:hypothetical protein